MIASAAIGLVLNGNNFGVDHSTTIVFMSKHIFKSSITAQYRSVTYAFYDLRVW